MRLSLQSLARRVVIPALFLLTPALGSAQGFSFFGTFGLGPNAGTIAGTLTLDGFTSGATGTYSASSLVLTQYPGGIITSPEGNEATQWSMQLANSFSTNSGLITDWQFIALTGTLNLPDSYLLCLNTGATVSLPVFGVCSEGLNFVGTGGSENFAYNFDGSQGLTFVPNSSTVPEPGSLAMLLAGLSAMGVITVRRRQSRA